MVIVSSENKDINVADLELGKVTETTSRGIKLPMIKRDAIKVI